jgi:hypothetical protein
MLSMPAVTIRSLSVLTKVDLCILPLMLAASFLAHLDKVLSTPVSRTAHKALC